jgi:preprotein translocase subunit SecG
LHKHDSCDKINGVKEKGEFLPMTGIQLVLTIILMLVAAVLIISVLLQKGDEDGLSALGAKSGDSYFGKNKDKSMQGRLATLTKVSAIVFIVLTFAMRFV